MKTQKYLIFTVVLGICLADVSAADSSQTAEPEIQTALVGLEGVAVTVSGLLQSARRAGLNKKRFQNDLETRLKAAGINVLTEQQAKTTPGRPTLSVNISTVELKLADDTLFVVSIRLLLTQAAFLARDPEVAVFAGTWGKGTVVVYDRNKLARGTKTATAKLMDQFIKDYLAANPTAQMAPQDNKMLTGKVRYLDLEGGFYGLVADDGQKYDPTNLPAEYKKDGLRVKFQIREKKGMASFHMWGKIVEIVKIQKQ